MDDLVVDEIVSDRKQRTDEDSIALCPFRQPRIAIGHRRQLLGIETALGAGRNDHCVLDQLRLHQAQDLGAEIVAAVRPASASAGNGPTAEVNALDAGAVYPDLAPRHWARKAGDERRID